MASKQALRPKKHTTRAVTISLSNNSPTSSTSSSRQYLEPSVDGLSSPASSSARSKSHYFYSGTIPLDVDRSVENVTVTVRFRPLSPREIRQGEEIAWYADGETIVRNEQNQSIAYAYDRVFGPTTTTRHTYDFAAQHIVSGAMEGINGTIFAYGVTSSGKTHTMHGDQRSPGIIPLAVKDAFSIIQETPSREFLLRISYLEIYNEVVNDLLNPAGQNLRIREDTQGTFVEGVKEEVVLSPAHALSLIAAGEEHRHVGSTNFNSLSSRSHTIFTLTIESSPCGENSVGEAVTLSQLNLIDLAGSESSRAETTGLRRKEGSFINKSLLTLGTVISKLTDGKSAHNHIPYRNSKLTRLLQSSLSGHGRISLICTVTPSSSNSEETHNTLKFAHRAKHIEIQAEQNKIVDEKSLIKKYQNEIRSLKEELEQLKRGIVTDPPEKDGRDGDIMLLKQKLEDGQVRLHSRLEEEEEAKAALMGRIQRLTKLILVSTKSQASRFPHRPGPRRRHSFGEEELAYLPYRRRDLVLDDDNVDLCVSIGENDEALNDKSKEEKGKKNGLLNWLKLRKRDRGIGTLASSSDISSGVISTSNPSTPKADSSNIHVESRPSYTLFTETTPPFSMVHYTEFLGPEENYLVQESQLSGTKTIDEIDILREQQKILSGKLAFPASALKLVSEEASDNLQKETSQAVAELTSQLNEKSFELEVKVADNRIIQEQLTQKVAECEDLQQTVASLTQQLTDAYDQRSFSPLDTHVHHFPGNRNVLVEYQDGREDGVIYDSSNTLFQQAQANEVEELRKKVAELSESKDELDVRNRKLAQESAYAKGLASAAAVELKSLSEEVAKLMNQNEQLTAELETQKKLLPAGHRRTTTPLVPSRSGRPVKRNDQNLDLKKELALIREREQSYEAALVEKDHVEAELHRRLAESKQRESYLENELANMWVLVAKLKKNKSNDGSELMMMMMAKENQKTEDDL